MMYLGDQAVGMATSLPIFSDKVKIEFGEYTPIQDETANTKLLSHSLGVIPDFIIYTSSGLDMGVSYNSMYLISGFTICSFNSNATNDWLIVAMRLNTDGTLGRASAATTQENIINSMQLSNESFCLTGFSNYKLKAGVTYKYILGKFKGVTSNAI